MIAASSLLRLFLVGVPLAACTPSPELPPVRVFAPAELAAIRYKMVVVAGDGRLPAFDNAVAALADRLQLGAAVSPGDIKRLSAAPLVVAQPGVASASLGHVLGAIDVMRPGPGQGCLVFATSHGIQNRGLSLATYNEVLSPKELDWALARSCGNEPTVVIVSGCFSGGFAQAPMSRDNRIVCVIRRIPAGYSGGNQPVIPTEASHPFRLIPATPE